MQGLRDEGLCVESFILDPTDEALPCTHAQYHGQEGEENRVYVFHDIVPFYAQEGAALLIDRNA
jgi:hypothetical protein